jgi:hypothetical protein
MKKMIVTVFMSVIALIAMGGIFSCAKSGEAKAVVYYTNPANLMVHADKAGAGLIPVYFTGDPKNNSRVIKSFVITLTNNNTEGVITANYIGEDEKIKGKTVLFYSNPMYPKDFSETTKKDDMGMDFAAIMSEK